MFYYVIGLLALLTEIKITDTMYNCIITVLIPLPSLVNPCLEIYRLSSANIKHKKQLKEEKGKMLINKIVMEQKKNCLYKFYFTSNFMIYFSLQ